MQYYINVYMLLVMLVCLLYYRYYMTDVDWKLLALQAGFNKPAKYGLIRCLHYYDIM